MFPPLELSKYSYLNRNRPHKLVLIYTLLRHVLVDRVKETIYDVTLLSQLKIYLI